MHCSIFYLATQQSLSPHTQPIFKMRCRSCPLAAVLMSETICCDAQLFLPRCTIKGIEEWRLSDESLKIMSKNNDEVWKTKYGFRRVRHEAPTLEEAIAAAQGLSDEVNQQAEIAASLIGLPHDQVRTELLKVAPPRKGVTKLVAFAGPASAPRTIVVERKPARPVIS